MRTIEKRAEYYERQCINNTNALGRSELPRPSESYKQGAEDQQKVDIKVFIKKALEYLEEALQCGVHPCSKDSFIIGFKKAMEE